MNKLFDRLDTIEFLLCCALLLPGERESLIAERDKIMNQMHEALIDDWRGE